MNEQKRQEILQNAVITMTVLQENEKLYASCDVHSIATQPHAFIAPLTLALLMNGLYNRVIDAIPEQVRKDYIEEYQHIQTLQNQSNKIEKISIKEEKPKLELISADTTAPETSGNGWEYTTPKLEIY